MPAGSIIVGVTTAPRRVSYLDRTVESLRGAGFSRPIIFADYGSDGDCVQTEHAGTFQNWLSALRILSTLPGDFVLLAQDDVLFCRNIRGMLDAMPWPYRCGCISLYTSSKDAHGIGLGRLKNRNPFGALAYLFPRDVARKIVRDEVAWSWRSHRNVDQFCPTVIINRLNLRFYSFSPSLCQHIGEVSTSKEGHAAHGRLAASDFVGAGYDAQYYFSSHHVGTPGELSAGHA